MASRFDRADPGIDHDYTDSLGGHPGVARTCFGCGDTTFVDANEPYQLQVFCDRCQRDRTPKLEPLAAVVDPAEHAAHTILDALSTLEKELAATFDLSRAFTLKQLTQRAWQAVEHVDQAAAAKLDAIQERRR